MVAGQYGHFSGRWRTVGEILSELVTLSHARHAVMFSILATAGRQVRFIGRSLSNERKNQRREEDGQQQDGKKSSHHL
jgi:hypothetical protein